MAGLLLLPLTGTADPRRVLALCLRRIRFGPSRTACACVSMMLIVAALPVVACECVTDSHGAMVRVDELLLRERTPAGPLA